MSLRQKASWVLFRLYRMRNMDFANVTVENILSKATEEEINYYYHWLCEVKC